MHLHTLVVVILAFRQLPLYQAFLYFLAILKLVHLVREYSELLPKYFREGVYQTARYFGLL